MQKRDLVIFSLFVAAALFIAGCQDTVGGRYRSDSQPKGFQLNGDYVCEDGTQLYHGEYSKLNVLQECGLAASAAKNQGKKTKGAIDCASLDRMSCELAEECVPLYNNDGISTFVLCRGILLNEETCSITTDLPNARREICTIPAGFFFSDGEGDCYKAQSDCSLREVLPSICKTGNTARCSGSVSTIITPNRFYEPDPEDEEIPSYPGESYLGS